MLAKMGSPKLIDPEGYYKISEKLDGQPVKIIRVDGVLEAYSRQGKRVYSIQHILDELDTLELILADGQYLCGELFNKDMGSAEISGLVRKNEPALCLSFYIFTDFKEPLRDKLVRGRNVHYLKYWYMKGSWLLELYNGDAFKGSDILKLNITNIFGDEGLISTDMNFEGFIARKDTTPWLEGKRSNDYLKLLEEPTLDMKVIGFEEAVSKDKEPLGRVGAFIVKWDGGTCKVGAGKLTHNEAKQFWQGYQEGAVLFDNMIIEVKYKQDNKYTSPRQPTFQRFREDKTEYQTTF